MIEGEVYLKELAYALVGPGQNLQAFSGGCAGLWFLHWENMLGSSVDQSAEVHDESPSDKS